MAGSKKIELRGRLSGQQKTRLYNLFDMVYRPSELAEEIGFEVRQVYRVYIPLGLPHERDEHNNIWINGLVFKEWILEKYRKTALDKNEAFCLTCKKAVDILDPEEREKDGLYYLICQCPHCGRKLAKIKDRKV